MVGKPLIWGKNKNETILMFLCLYEPLYQRTESENSRESEATFLDGNPVFLVSTGTPTHHQYNMASSFTSSVPAKYRKGRC